MRCERCNNFIEMDGDRIPECEWNGDGWVCPVQEHVPLKYKCVGCVHYDLKLGLCLHSDEGSCLANLNDYFERRK